MGKETLDREAFVKQSECSTRSRSLLFWLIGTMLLAASIIVGQGWLDGKDVAAVTSNFTTHEAVQTEREREQREDMEDLATSQKAMQTDIGEIKETQETGQRAILEAIKAIRP